MNKIYKITNIFNDKIYVGQTWNTLKYRFAQHLSNRIKGKLTNAIKKYGKESFKIEFLVLTHTQEVADYWESYFIDRYDGIKNGYNTKEGGSRGRQSETTKKKISKKAMGHKRNLGKPHSEERKHNSSIAHIGIRKGIFLSREHRDKISESHLGENNHFYGKTHTDEARKLISKANKGKTWKLIDGKRVWMEKE